jgi:hypothetical protein
MKLLMSRHLRLLALLGPLVLHVFWPIVGEAAPPSKPAPTVPRSLPIKVPGQVPTQQELTPQWLSEIAERRYLDPGKARELYEKGMAEARNKYPHLSGKPSQEHHVIPKYLGGPKSGKTVKIDPAYHQLLTNRFRERYAYGQSLPKPGEIKDILLEIYSKYPLPGVHF